MSGRMDGDVCRGRRRIMHGRAWPLIGRRSRASAADLVMDRLGYPGDTGHGAARSGRRMASPHARPAAPLLFPHEGSRHEAAVAKGKARAPSRKKTDGTAPMRRNPKAQFEDRIDLRDFLCLERPIMRALDRRWSQSQTQFLKRAARIVTFNLLVTTTAAMNGSIGAWLDAVDFCQSSEIPLPKPLADRTVDMIMSQALQFGSNPKPLWPVSRRDQGLTRRIQYEWIKARLENVGNDQQWRYENTQLQSSILARLAESLDWKTVLAQFGSEWKGEPLKGDKVRDAIAKKYRDRAVVDRIYREVFMPDMDIVWSQYHDWNERYNVQSEETAILAAKIVKQECNTLPAECRGLMSMRGEPEDIAKVYHQVKADRKKMLEFEWGDQPDWEDFPFGQLLWPGRYYLPTEKS